ncbi:MAG: 5'/3'-nucleotidase SurE [Clostridiaceae bacterium]|nr:5'/3'-nucleotidase SurE [Clostridiaceae bacterium]
MKLLLTNDDGVSAKGLFALAKELEKENEVTVVAPDDERSACGHSITLTRALLVKEIKVQGLRSKCYSVDGTPADCVRIAVDKIVSGKIDMVISGINRGLNIGTDILYSGTVSAAIEAAFCKIPSMAVSMEETDKLEDYNVAATYAKDILKLAKEKYLKEDIVLNVNVPNIPKEKILGIKVCKIGNRSYDNYFTPEFSDEKELSFEVQGNLNSSFEENTDKNFVKEGYVTITPLHYDLTNYKILKEVNDIFGVE